MDIQPLVSYPLEEAYESVSVNRSLYVTVSVCLFVDHSSGAADVGRQRQASVSSPGSGALQSTEEQSLTCQVQQSKVYRIKPVTLLIKLDLQVLIINDFIPVNCFVLVGCCGFQKTDILCPEWTHRPTASSTQRCGYTSISEHAPKL